VLEQVYNETRTFHHHTRKITIMSKELPVELVINILSFIKLIDIVDCHRFKHVNSSWQLAMECYTAHKPRTITFGFVGVSQVGKSCILSQLLKQTGFVKATPVDHHNEKESDNSEKSHYLKHATLIDQLKEEKSALHTVHIHRKSIFLSEEDSYTFVDTPGSLAYVKNTIRAISQCNVVVLVLSAHKDDFESDFRRVMDLIRIAYIMSVHNFIVVVNKIETVPAKKQLQRFVAIKQKMDNYFAALFTKKRLGVDYSKIPYVPVSSLLDINIGSNDSKLSWYSSGKFPSLWEQINLTNQMLRMHKYEDALNYAMNYSQQDNAMLFSQEDEDEIDDTDPSEKDIRFTMPYDPLFDFERLKDEGFRLSVDKVFKIPHVGTVASGTVLSGTISLNEQLIIEPGGYEAKVKNIRILKRDVAIGVPGDYVSLQLGHPTSKKCTVERGSVISKPIQPEYQVDEFTVKLIMITPLTMKIIKPGWEANVFSNCAYARSTLIEIESSFNKDNSTVAATDGSPKFLNKKQGGFVKFKAMSPICLTSVDRCPRLAKVIFRDGVTDTVCVGLVTKVKYKDNKQHAVQAKSKNQSAVTNSKQQPLPFPRTITTDEIWKAVAFSEDLWNGA
jgi:translation elongation factor EF-1alpha